MKDTLKHMAYELYERAVYTYTALFCLKHGFQLEYSFWVGDKIGEVFCINEFYFNFNDIKTDIDEDVPEHILMEYYESASKAHSENEPFPNYESFINLAK